MKKVCILVIGLALIVFAITGCGREQQSGQEPATPVDTALTAPTVQPAAAVYYCPMDPEIVSDKPGKCSKCGMDLIEKPAASE